MLLPVKYKNNNKYIIQNWKFNDIRKKSKEFEAKLLQQAQLGLIGQSDQIYHNLQVQN